MIPPPIADPHSYEEPFAPKPPFLGLRIFVFCDLAVLLVSPLDAVFSTNPHRALISAVGFQVIYMSLWCLLLWYLWRGLGIARAIFLWVNAFLFLPVPFVGFALEWTPLWLKWLNYLGDLFILGGMLWLHLPEVKAHFRREQSV